MHRPFPGSDGALNRASMGAPLKDHRQAWQEQVSPPATAGFGKPPYTCFRLRPTDAAVARGFVRLLAQGDRLCIAPAFAETPLLVMDPHRRARLSHHLEDAAIEPVGPMARLSRAIRAFNPSYAKATLRFDGATICPEGGRSAVRNYRKLIKFARAANMAFDGESLRSHPELALGFSQLQETRQNAPERTGPPTAVAMHLHYAELWPEIAFLLKRWRARFQLFVTLTREDDALARRIAADFPAAKVDVVENRGRDVRPFLQLLESGALDAYELVCKIHGKRSLRSGASPLFGEMFRRATLLDLIGSDTQVEAIQNRFASDPLLGLVGPERFRARSRHNDPTEIMGSSRATIETLAQRMGAEIGQGEYDVFHGTMFWARPKALAGLRELGLAANGFSPESGREDGAMEHAVEGLINHAVRAAGFQVAGTSF
jgi:hypothetical protein